jgi:hypothetical protein
VARRLRILLVVAALCSFLSPLALLEREREAELRGVGKDVVRGVVEAVDGDLATIRCSPPSSRRGTASRGSTAAGQGVWAS